MPRIAVEDAGLDAPTVEKGFEKWTKDPVVQKMAEKYESKAALGKFFNHRDPGYQNVDMQLLHKEYDQVQKEMQGPQIGV